MFKLLKYEFRKTRPARLILLGLTVLLEALFLFFLFTEKEGGLITACALLLLDALCGIMILGIQSVITLHRDMNTRQGYMLFMTPHSNYTILFAKLLECGLSLLLGGLCFFGLGVLDVTLVFQRFGQLDTLWDLFRQVLTAIDQDIQINLPNVAGLAFNAVTGWLLTVATAFLADVIVSSMLKGKKGAGFLAFLFFVILSMLTSALMKLIPSMSPLALSFTVGGLVSLILSAVMVYITATLMEKYLSV